MWRLTGRCAHCRGGVGGLYGSGGKYRTAPPTAGQPATCSAQTSGGKPLTTDATQPHDSQMISLGIVYPR